MPAPDGGHTTDTSRIVERLRSVGLKATPQRITILKELLGSIQDKPMNDQKEAINSSLDEWMSGVDQVDDILIMGIRI